jgi:hypothetical protein
MGASIETTYQGHHSSGTARWLPEICLIGHLTSRSGLPNLVQQLFGHGTYVREKIDASSVLSLQQTDEARYGSNASQDHREKRTALETRKGRETLKLVVTAPVLAAVLGCWLDPHGPRDRWVNNDVDDRSQVFPFYFFPHYALVLLGSGGRRKKSLKSWCANL